MTQLMQWLGKPNKSPYTDISSPHLLPPRIDPVPVEDTQPYWSVMIPTYNVSELFEQSLRSVLDQDPGPSQMQITVVDDCSTNGRLEEIIRRLAPSRVEFYKQPRNIGLAGNWNTCIERARGRWVHILHQDDLMLRGFYERMSQAGRKNPEIGSIVCRHRFIDAKGDFIHVSDLERDTPGILEGWLPRIASWQRLQCPAVVVRRTVYEELGGFRHELCYVLDWEMWVRIAARYPVWFEPEVLACYRCHADNETARLSRENRTFDDIKNGMTIMSHYLPKAFRVQCRREVLRSLGQLQFAKAAELMRVGQNRAGLIMAYNAYRCNPSIDCGQTLFAYGKWATKNWLTSLCRLRKQTQA